jgi:hypothetical protein
MFSTRRDNSSDQLEVLKLTSAVKSRDQQPTDEPVLIVSLV